MTLLAILLLPSCSAFNVTYLVDIVVAVKQHFRSGCVCVVHDQDTGKSGKFVTLLGNKNLILRAYMLWQFSSRKNLIPQQKIRTTSIYLST
jgi:lauroyl/myristoyl acyltransferase